MGKVIDFPPHTTHKPWRSYCDSSSVTSIEGRREALKLQAIQEARIHAIVNHIGKDVFHDNCSVLSGLITNGKLPPEWTDSLYEYMIGID